MLTYKLYYNMAPPYLCELINKKSRVNTRMGTDHQQLIMPPISNTFLERSFICAAPCQWNKLSEHIRTSNFDCFRKIVKTMLLPQQYGCWLSMCILLLFMMWSLLIIVNAFCYIVHWTRTFMYIGYWTLNKLYYYYY